MSAISFKLVKPTRPAILRTYWLEIAWVVWTGLNVAAIVLVPSGETIPFHFIWVSLSLVYAYRMWRLHRAALALMMVFATTGVALAWALVESEAGFDEWAEVPLMSLMVVAMIWHVELRQRAHEEAARLAAKELRLIERQRDMIRDVSHELRTPITIARGHAELVKAAYPGQLAAEDADVILHELTRLSTLAERLLILAAAEHSDFLRPGPVNVGDLVNQAGTRWAGTAERRWSLRVETNAVIVADEERLSYAIDALIENAVKFTEDGEAITLAVEDDEDGVVITVSDTGIGIPEGSTEEIFERFARVESSGGRRNGTGLGLAIVKAVAEAHGGSVRVKSRPGVGSSFELRLPADWAAGPVSASQ